VEGSYFISIFISLSEFGLLSPSLSLEAEFNHEFSLVNINGVPK
jgi:hypothetical protein